MKRKFGTSLDEELITQLKILAAKEQKRVSQVIEEALRQYLRYKQSRVVKQTQGALPASPQIVQAVLREEEEFYAGAGSG